MSALVVYYSYTGHAKKRAETFAAAESAPLAEIKEVERPGKLQAYTTACFAAMRGKPWPIQPLDSDLAAYDKIVLFAPVWANNPPPFVYAFFDQLPAGKAVTVNLVSGSGKGDCKERLEAILKAKGCTLEGYQVFK